MGCLKESYRYQGEHMPKTISKETKEEKIASKQSEAMIITAVISSATTLIVGLVVAFLGFPPFQESVRSWSNSPKSQSIVIEQIPFTVYTFEGDDDPSCCVGQSYFKYTIDKNLTPIYGLDYILPENDPRHGYAGIAFIFEQSQDFSNFGTLEFSVNFGETINQVDVSMEDITLAEADFHITGSNAQANSFIVPISNFKKINLKAVRSIEFQVNSTYASKTNWIDVFHIRLTTQK
jgi:hypothetical protein